MTTQSIYEEFRRHARQFQLLAFRTDVACLCLILHSRSAVYGSITKESPQLGSICECGGVGLLEIAHCCLRRSQRHAEDSGLAQGERHASPNEWVKAIVWQTPCQNCNRRFCGWAWVVRLSCGSCSFGAKCQTIGDRPTHCIIGWGHLHPARHHLVTLVSQASCKFFPRPYTLCTTCCSPLSFTNPSLRVPVISLAAGVYPLRYG